MSDTDRPTPDDSPIPADQPEVLQAEQAPSAEAETAEKLHLEVSVENRGACERHISVTVPREDIDRYFGKEYDELMPEAQVPGFRPGRAPRKLVERRFQKEIEPRVKSSLLFDSLEQIHEDYDLAAIGEPDIDLDSVEVPDEGPLTFEFDLEVRPDFELPKWQGMSLERPVRDITDADVDRALQRVLGRRGRLFPSDAPAEMGDYISTNLTFKVGEQVLSSAEEEVIRIRPVLSFRDGRIENFGELMVGVQAGETRTAETQLSEDAPNAGLRGAYVTAVFEVLEVKKLELPELTPELLEELGGFELEADLRDAIRDQLARQLDYEQRRRVREQIAESLVESADWDLPPELLQRQSRRELQRAVMELRRSGFSDEEIQAHENELRQNSLASTARSLKEHFILERIAEEVEIDATKEDYDEEIRLIALQSDTSPRRVRAQLEKSGSMDVLRNQVIERKVIDLIREKAQFEDVPYEFEEDESEAIAQSAGGHGEDIPEAKTDRGEPSEGGRPHEPPTHE